MAPLALVLGAAAFGAVTRLALPPLAWLSLPLLLRATRSMNLVSGTIALWAVLFVSLVIAKRDTIPIGGAIVFPIIAAETTIVVLAFALDRAAAPRVTGVAATLVFPLALTAAEFLRARLTPAATWGSIAYSQYGWLPVMQVASVAGIWGITFLLGWAGSVAELAWRSGAGAPQVRGSVLACGIVVAAALAAGTLRIALAQTDTRVLRAATLNRPRDLFAPGEMTRITEGRIDPGERERVREQLTRLRTWFLDGARREARAGARIVAWPEQNLLVLSDEEPAFLEQAARVAADEHAYLVAGMGTIHLGDPRPFENKVVVFDPSGRQIVSHLKTRAVAGWEASIMKPGTEPVPVVSTPDGRLAAAICFEADFPEIVRAAGRGGADALVVVTNDWRAIADVHLRMHAFRAIENGVAILRPAASGLSAAVDPWGRTLGLADFFAPDGGTMVAQVPMRHVPTFYARCGDWLAWLSIGALAALLIWSLVPRP